MLFSTKLNEIMKKLIIALFLSLTLFSTQSNAQQGACNGDFLFYVYVFPGLNFFGVFEEAEVVKGLIRANPQARGLVITIDKGCMRGGRYAFSNGTWRRA